MSFTITVLFDPDRPLPDPLILTAWVEEELAATRAELQRAESLMLDVMRQACETEVPGELDSQALREYSDALHWLATRGKVVVMEEQGRRVLARVVEGTTRSLYRNPISVVKVHPKLRTRVCATSWIGP